MSTLASRLLSNNEGADSGLDAIFKSSAGAAVSSKSHEGSSAKRPAEEEASLASAPKKRAKTAKSKKQADLGEQPSTAVDFKREKKKSKKAVAPAAREDEAPEEGASAPDPKVTARKSKGSNQTKDASKGSTQPSKDPQGSKKKKNNHKTKYVPPGEKPEEVDARTVFVGNLPASMVKNNAAMKSLIRHLTSTLPPTAKARVESTRFRSVAFSQSTKSSKDALGDEMEAEESDEEGATKPDRLTSSQKKRLAFLKGEINEKAEVVNCYVVFGHHRSSFVDEGVSKAASEEKPMIPSEVAQLVVHAANGTTFMDRVIRVDRVGVATSSREEMKRMVFVGSLDFEAQEDDVRTFFEELLKAERGERVPEQPEPQESTDDVQGEEDEGKDTSNIKHRSWVQSVRIVRDPDSQLGKGIAYVQFQDVQCVDELLALPSTKLSFRKRTLRLQRCKTLPRATSSKNTPALPVSPSKPSSSRSPTKTANSRAPRGDPGLGARIADLTKAERKEAKALDTDRVARRLAKKKQRADLEKDRGPGRRSGAKEGVLGKMPKSTKPKNPGSKKAKKIRK